MALHTYGCALRACSHLLLHLKALQYECVTLTKNVFIYCMINKLVAVSLGRAEVTDRVTGGFLPAIFSSSCICRILCCLYWC